jgi:hypothetical protein
MSLVSTYIHAAFVLASIPISHLDLRTRCVPYPIPTQKVTLTPTYKFLIPFVLCCVVMVSFLEIGCIALNNSLTSVATRKSLSHWQLPRGACCAIHFSKARGHCSELSKKTETIASLTPSNSLGPYSPGPCPLPSLSQLI